MPEEQKAKPQAVPAKSFMTVGPTLHYSHSNVIRCWAFAVIAYVLTCLFWSKILTGAFFSLGAAGPEAAGFQRLSRFTLVPLNIFEYPWQIVVLGLLMGVLAVVPVLISVVTDTASTSAVP